MYEEVDEEQYSKLVQERQEDDWIIDDGKTQLFFVVKNLKQNKKPRWSFFSVRWYGICGGRTRNFR